MKNKTFLKSKQANLFLPNRAVFLDGGPEKKAENPQTNAFADQLEKTAEKNADKNEGKQKIDIKNIVGNAKEIKPDNAALYNKLLNQLMSDLKKNIKPREPQHGDKIGGTIDETGCYLVIDENNKPSARIFMNEKKHEAAGNAQEGITEDEIMSKAPYGYSEMANPPADIVKYAKELFSQQAKAQDKAKGMQHGDLVRVTEGSTIYIVIRDDHKKKDRVFKSP